MTEVTVDPRTGRGTDGRQYRQSEGGVWRVCAEPGEMFRGAAVVGVVLMLTAVVAWLVAVTVTGW